MGEFFELFLIFGAEMARSTQRKIIGKIMLILGKLHFTAVPGFRVTTGGRA